VVPVVVPLIACLVAQTLSATTELTLSTTAELTLPSSRLTDVAWASAGLTRDVAWASARLTGDRARTSSGLTDIAQATPGLAGDSAGASTGLAHRARSRPEPGSPELTGSPRSECSCCGAHAASPRNAAASESRIHRRSGRRPSESGVRRPYERLRRHTRSAEGLGRHRSTREPRI
jgi:hypothetical protein